MLIAAFIIGLVVLVGKVGWLAVKLAWGVVKSLLFVLALPVILVVLVVAGLVKLALPLLVIALLAAFIGPKMEKK